MSVIRSCVDSSRNSITLTPPRVNEMAWKEEICSLNIYDFDDYAEARGAGDWYPFRTFGSSDSTS